jgi:hypothetical protein
LILSTPIKLGPIGASAQAHCTDTLIAPKHTHRDALPIKTTLLKD